MRCALRMEEPRKLMRWRLRLRLVTILFALLPVLPAHANETADWSRAMAIAIERLDKRDCAGAWNTVWPFARNGHSEALSFLFGITLYSIDPPAQLPHTGYLGEPFSRRDHGLALAMYGWRSRVPDTDFDATKLVNGLAREYGTSQLKRLARCMKAQREKDMCVNMAVKMKLIPSFKDYVILTERSKRPASCVSYGEREYP